MQQSNGFVCRTEHAIQISNTDQERLQTNNDWKSAEKLYHKR